MMKAERVSGVRLAAIRAEIAIPAEILAELDAVAEERDLYRSKLVDAYCKCQGFMIHGRTKAKDLGRDIVDVTLEYAARVEQERDAALAEVARLQELLSPSVDEPEQVERKCSNCMHYGSSSRCEPCFAVIPRGIRDIWTRPNWTPVDGKSND